jgi:capsular polysaccharide biosynthesis protein
LRKLPNKDVIDVTIEKTPNDEVDSVQELQDIKQDIDLLNYIYAVFDAKWFILFVAIVTGGLSMLYALSLPETYQGVVRVDVIDISDPGGVRPDRRQMQESIGMLEYDFLLRAKKENYVQKILAHLRSKKFTRQFLDSYNIYRYIYPQEWDNATSTWNEAFLLDKGLAQKIFMKDLIQIAHALETDIVAVKVIDKDPAIAAELSNLYVYAFNQYMREQALAKVDRKFRYLEETLDQTGATEIQQMLFRLMEAQTAVAMLANGRKEYILEVLDPAVSPYLRYSPNRKLICILGAVAGALLSTSLVMALTVLGRLKTALASYSVKTGRKPIAQRRWGLRALLLKLFYLVRHTVKPPDTAGRD